MSEEGQQHPQEPAEGGEGDAQAPRAERPGEVEESVGNLTDAPAGLEHPAEPADPAKRPSRRGVPSDKGVTARGPVRREAGCTSSLPACARSSKESVEEDTA
jgi:hypothetical protein